MTDGGATSLPKPAFEGGTKAITATPVVGTPRRTYADVYIPGEEPLEDGELRVTVLGSGNPWVTRAQASASVLVEVGNPERDLLLFDVGSGSLANYASLKLPVNLLDKVFLTHLHADHTSDLLTLSGSYSKVGRADGPVRVWGPSGDEPDLGTKHFCEGIEAALAWDTAAGRGPINDDSMRIEANEFDWRQTGVVYEANGVKVTSFPVIHALSGSVGYRLDFAGLSFGFSGDTCAGWPLVRACEGVDLLIHECFPPGQGAGRGLGAVHRTRNDSAQRRSHLADRCGQGVQSRQAAGRGALAHPAFGSGGRYDPRGAPDGVRRGRRPDPGPDGFQHHERGGDLASGARPGSVAPDPWQAARDLHAGPAEAPRMVGRGPTSARLGRFRPTGGRVSQGAPPMVRKMIEPSAPTPINSSRNAMMKVGVARYSSGV